MTAAAVTRLVALFSPPPPRRTVDWGDTEQRLGQPVPQDYKDLIGAFGQAVFCDSVETYQPHSDPLWDMATATLEAREQLTDDSANNRPSHTPDGKLFDTSKVVSWGKDAGGGYWLWYPNPDETGKADRYYVVAATPDQVFWKFFDGTTSEFLNRYVTGAEPPPGQPGHVGEMIGDGPPFVDIYVDGQPTRYSA